MFYLFLDGLQIFGSTFINFNMCENNYEDTSRYNALVYCEEQMSNLRVFKTRFENSAIDNRYFTDNGWRLC